MATETVPDNYSNDDKGNEVFALPLVGRRRKACEAGFKGPGGPQPKRQNQQSSAVANKVKDEQIPRVEMKRTQSAYPINDKPFTSLFLER